MAITSVGERQRSIEAALGGEARYVDVALMLTRDKTDETLLYVGGQWDRLDRRFTDKTPERISIVPLEESQVEFTRWFEKFLADYRDGYPRDISLALVAGNRRGGKTFDTVLCTIAALIEVPFNVDGTASIGWMISKTYRQRDELEEVVSSRIDSQLYHHRKAPDHRYEFAHGAVLKNLSADDPDSLKQGRVDFLLLNEAQLMSPRAVKNGMYGTSDRGGLTVLAANPPDGPDGDWLRDLKDAIDEDPEIKSIAKFFNFDAAKNTKVDAPSRKKNAKLASKILPEGADGDADGTWRRWGDLACPGWNGRTLERGGLVGPAPDIGFSDATTSTLRREFGRSFDFAIGADFQRKPQAAAILKILTLPDVQGPVYWFIDEIGTKGTEIELSTELLGIPHSYGQRSGETRAAMIIGDCSGSWQGSERIAGRTSFNLLEHEGWYVVPAETIKGKASERPRNPPVAQRLGLLQRLMEARRIRVDPRCTWLVESFAKCQLRKTETGTRVPKGYLAHILDAASYAIWRLEPRLSGGAPPKPGSFKTMNVRPKGMRII